MMERCLFPLRGTDMFQNQTAEAPSEKHLYLRLILLVLSTLFISLALLYGFILVGQVGRMEYLPVGDSIRAEVIYPNGYISRSVGDHFTSAYKGYTIRLTVPLPEEEKLDNAALCFELYHNLVQVRWGDQLLAEVGRERMESGRQIGHQRIVAVIPDEAWGSELSIVCLPQERQATNQLKNPVILKATDARLFTLIHNQFDLIIFSTLLVFSMVALVAFVMMYLLGFRRLFQGILLSLFLLAVCTWYLSYQGVFFAFSVNADLFVTLEDYALFAMPIPMLAYLRRENFSKNLKRLCLVFECLFALLLVLVIVADLVPGPIRVADLTPPMRVVLVIAMVMIITMLMSTKPEAKPTLSDRILRIGMAICLVLAVMEVLRITMSNMPALWEIDYIRAYIQLKFTRVMILVFLLVLLASFGMRLVHVFRQDLEARHLTVIAYTDLLTGIPNRQACEQAAREIGDREKKGCAVLFFDSNDLKMANDVYGHEEGDELLRQIGQALAGCMKNRIGFYGRYGGDEFIACTYYNEEAHEIERQFYHLLDDANRRQVLPFEISVACGIASYAELERDASGKEPTMEELIAEADRRMYENKKAMKKARAAVR